jgi:hypothetical protein
VASHTVAVELFYDSAWNEHSTDAYQRDGMTMKSGVSDESQEATPGSAVFTFANRSGDMNPMNPNGALVGKIGQNTPIRITIDGDQRFYGEMAQWKPGRAIKGDAWVGATAAGILRRLGRGVDPLRSPIYRAVNFAEPIAFWPLSDGQNATQAGSAISGGNPLTPAGTVTFAAVDGPAGDQQKFPEFADPDTSVLVGQLAGVVPGTDTGAWSVEWWFAGKGVPSSTPLAECIHVAFSGAAFATMTCQIQGGTGGPVISVYFLDGAGSVVDGPYARFIQPFDNGWHHVRVTAVQNNPTSATIAAYIDGVLGTTATFNTDIGYPVGTVVAPTSAQNSDVTSLSVADLAVYDAAVGDHYDAGLGWAGELAGDRFLRLCDEQGIDADVVTDPADTQPMGIQGVTTLLEQFAEIERTDWGRIYESRTSLQLLLRTGHSMLNQDSVLTLNYNGGEIAPVLEPVVGDAHIRNDVTAAGRSGSTARYEQTAGAYNVQEPGTAEGAVGRYTTRIDVNPDDQSLLRDFAALRVFHGTFNGTWYESVTVDLDAAPSLTADVAAVTIGDKITLINLPEDETAGAVEHLVIGIVEQLPDQTRRLITFNLVPAKPYTMGILGATDVEGWLDCGGSTTNEALDATETGVDLLITDDCTWTHADGDYNILIGAEEMTVTAVGAVGGSPGAQTQTLTVTRSVNGVVTTHSTGAEVHVADPFILAL